MIHNAEDVLDHARWAARRAGKYALAHHLDDSLALVRGDPDKEHEEEIESLTDEVEKFEATIDTLEKENDNLRHDSDVKDERIAELEAEIAQMLAREASL